MNTSRPELRGDFGAVSSTHPLAASTGMAVLERGGNAFDAAVAAAFVLQVVEPHSNGPASDVSIVLHSAGDGVTRSICGQGPMPGNATLEHFQALGLGQIPGSGLLAATVPGAFGAWMRMLAEFGTMGLADVLDYAIGYAERGFPLLPETANVINVLEPLFATEWPGSGATYLPGGSAPAPWARFTNPGLARTYQRILRIAQQASSSREGQIKAANDAFYNGFVAEAIDAFMRAEMLDATGRRHRGLLTGQDLAGWEPEVEDATALDYRGYRICKPGAWSQGPVFLQQLALLDGFDLAAMGMDSADYVHTIVECAKLAFADREAWYGDPQHTKVPVDALLSLEYGSPRRNLVGDTASDQLRPGSPNGREPWIPVAPPAPDLTPEAAEWLVQLRSGLPTIVRATAARNDTCCVTVADRSGNLVAATPSGGWLKSSPAIPELGFPMGTRGQSMWLVEGHPNSLAPQRRPRTTLSPTVVLRDGDAHLGFGSPGGDRQDQWTLLFFLAAVHFGLDTQAATECLMFHCDAMPASFTPRESRPTGVTIERGVDTNVVDELRRRGHDVNLVPAMSLGKVCATGFTGHGGFLLAAASPRGPQAYAVSR